MVPSFAFPACCWLSRVLSCLSTWTWKLEQQSFLTQRFFLPPQWPRESRQSGSVTCGAIHQIMVTASQMLFLSLLVNSRRTVWSISFGLCIQECLGRENREGRETGEGAGKLVMLPASSQSSWVHSAFSTTVVHSETGENSDTLWHSRLERFAEPAFSPLRGN